MWTVDEPVSRFRFASNGAASSLPLARSPVGRGEREMGPEIDPGDSQDSGEHRRGGTPCASKLADSGAMKQRACAERATLPSTQPPTPLAGVVG